MKKTKNDTISTENVNTEFDKYLEVWYLAIIQGATLWGYCQEKDRKLPVDFQKGIDSVRESVKSDTDPMSTLKYLLGSTPVLLGLFDESLDGVMTSKKDFDKVLSTTSKVTPVKTKKKVSKTTHL